MSQCLKFLYWLKIKVTNLLCTNKIKHPFVCGKPLIKSSFMSGRPSFFRFIHFFFKKNSQSKPLLRKITNSLINCANLCWRQKEKRKEEKQLLPDQSARYFTKVGYLWWSKNNIAAKHFHDTSIGGNEKSLNWVSKCSYSLVFLKEVLSLIAHFDQIALFMLDRWLTLKVHILQWR